MTPGQVFQPTCHRKPAWQRKTIHLWNQVAILLMQYHPQFGSKICYVDVQNFTSFGKESTLAPLVHILQRLALSAARSYATGSCQVALGPMGSGKWQSVLESAPHKESAVLSTMASSSLVTPNSVRKMPNATCDLAKGSASKLNFSTIRSFPN